MIFLSLLLSTYFLAGCQQTNYAPEPDYVTQITVQICDECRTSLKLTDTDKTAIKGMNTNDRSNYINQRYPEEVISEEKLNQYANEIIAQFGTGQLALVSVGQNVVILNATRQAYDELLSSSPTLKDATIKTLYYERILPEQIAEPTSDSAVYACNYDDDCMMVKDGPCGCQSGGGNTAVNSQYVEYWESQWSAEDSLCFLGYNMAVSCPSVPRCINQVCQLTE